MMHAFVRLTPRERFLSELNKTLEAFEKIDKATPWQEVEPQWWLKMKKLEKEIRDIKENI